MNGGKNLFACSVCIQILRDAQDDTLGIFSIKFVFLTLQKHVQCTYQCPLPDKS